VDPELAEGLLMESDITVLGAPKSSGASDVCAVTHLGGAHKY